MSKIHSRDLNGITYYSTIACDGWPTGPCLSPEKALERVLAYEHGEEVGLAAPGQASYAQMHAYRAWLSELRHTNMELDDTWLAVEAALNAGLHSDEWVIASALMREVADDPLYHSVIHAGGSYVRRRLPEASIPTRSAG